MNRNKFLLMVLLLVFAAIPWNVDRGFAQSPAPDDPALVQVPQAPCEGKRCVNNVMREAAAANAAEERAAFIRSRQLPTPKVANQPAPAVSMPEGGTRP